MPQLNQRDNFTYAFAHLNVRDEVVFKSIVGLLAGRTHNQWQHVQSGEPDLLVLGADSSNVSADQRARAVLKIAYRPTDSHGLSVHWPLRANEVFERLEQVARLLEQSTPSTAFNPDSAYKLSCWPPQEILGRAPGNLRLATLLGARALSARELSERSGISLDACLECLKALHDGGLLLAESKPAQPRTESAPQGFFARLRAHLGLSSGQTESP